MLLSGVKGFLAEARRRKVFQTGGLSAVAVGALRLPPQALTFVVVASIVGFPFALDPRQSTEIPIPKDSLLIDVGRQSGLLRPLPR